ncbi:MAG: hypothetical protein ACRC11_11070 [Xenococcaceae cyanobacterium]
MFNRKAPPPIPRRFPLTIADEIRSAYLQVKSYQLLAERYQTCKSTINHIIQYKGAYKRDRNQNANFARDW